MSLMISVISVQRGNSTAAKVIKGNQKSRAHLLNDKEKGELLQ